MVIHGVAFDLDDTLFLERDYVSSGFRAIARQLAAETSRKAPEWEVELHRLASDPHHQGRVFDELLKRDPEVLKTCTVTALVAGYRSHIPEIDLLPGARDLLGELTEAKLRLGLITDGPASSQKAKLKALGLNEFLSPLIVTDEWGPQFSKPHERAFEHVENAWGSPGIPWSTSVTILPRIS